VRIHITSAYAHAPSLALLRDWATVDRFRVHGLVPDPEQADAVLFVENGQRDDEAYLRLRRHPWVERFGDRAYMYNEFDFPYFVLPGLYASMPKRSFDSTSQVAFGYLFRPNEFVSAIASEGTKPDLLFSFAGARNHRVRHRVLALRHPRAHVEDTHAFSIWKPVDAGEALRRKAAFAATMARSKFVLCPRGAGTSSFRIFETMEAGRVPVVIGDQWVEPLGPEWRFAIRVRESDVGRIPEILESVEGEAEERGRAARHAWLEWYAPDVIFHRVAEAIGMLADKARGRTPRKASSLDRELVQERIRSFTMSRARWLKDRLGRRTT
jgi:hypothetical protein